MKMTARPAARRVNCEAPTGPPVRQVHTARPWFRRQAKSHALATPTSAVVAGARPSPAATTPRTVHSPGWSTSHHLGLSTTLDADEWSRF
jgi:hypothetical protein